ncbi:Ig-like domain-containing protein, partial [Vibrio cyclitrophicus]
MDMTVLNVSGALALGLRIVVSVDGTIKVLEDGQPLQAGDVILESQSENSESPISVKRFSPEDGGEVELDQDIANIFAALEEGQDPTVLGEEFATAAGESGSSLVSSGTIERDGEETIPGTEFVTTGFEALGMSRTQSLSLLDAFRSVDQPDSLGTDSETIVDTTAPDAPTLTLDTDSGSAADDFLTNDGSFTVGGTEEGATVEYLVDGNWTTTAPVPTEGDNTITVRQTDAAGNTSGSSELTFTLDTTAPDAPTLTLDTDSGSAADDFLTNDGSFTVGGTEEGATVEYLVDGNWTTTAPVPTEGDNTITVRQTDAAGNTSGSSELTFTLDTTAPDAPTLTLDTDSGSAADDFLTNDGSFTVGGTEEGATVEYLVDGNWTTTAPVPTEGDNTITVRQTDAAGNTSGSSELTFTLDTTAPDAPTLTLDTDSGSAADDFLTNDGSFTVGGTEEGATVEYLVDGNWTTTAPVPTEGDNTITVRQTDAAGNTSGSSELTFTLDTTAPDAPTLTLDTDSGSAADDFLTNDGSFTVGGTEEGATVEYLVDGNWTTTAPVPTEGDNTITVRQTDAAGNTSGSSELTFTLDTTAPDAPTLTLDTDSGSAADDFLTNDGSFTVGGTEEGATVEYLVDGNWTTTAPVPTEGDNTITVRQTDAAGNTSGSSELTFTLDTTAPDAPTLTLDTDSGSAADDFLTNDGSFTVGGTEEGATVEYLVDGNWTTTAPVPTEGDNTITVRQTDAAGNTSGSSELTFTLDTTAPDAPTLTLDTDSGSAADDFLTNDGSFTVGGTEEGATVEYLVDGNWTTTAPVPTEGDNTITVRQTDAAGNTSGSSELTFTLDTTAPDAPTLTLDTDSGSAADDFLTNDGSFTVGGTEEGATVEYLVDGNWTTTAPVPTEGDNTITVRQTDAAGNTSGSSELTFTLDTTAPDAPTLTLDTDSGSAADDFLTNDGSFTVGGTEEGATVEYLVDGNWTTTAPVPTEGDNTITVRQTDAAGNTSGSSELTFTLDTTAPDAPTLTLDTDSGSAADDFLTNDGSFTVGGTEEGATVEYLVDGNWTTTAPVPTEGDNTITVRQTDAAGNTSGSSELTFTLDTTAPDAPTLTLDTDSGSAADDFLTNDGSFTVGGTEEGATVEYLVDGNWTTTAPVPTEGDNTITVRQTDAAGNTSGSSELTFTLDTTAPDAPTLTLDTDSGSAADDFLTNDGSFTVGGTEEGATVEYLVDGNWTTTAPVPTEGDNTITVRQTDAAGNTSGSSELTFTLDTTAPDAPTLTLDTDSGSAADDFLTNDGSFTVGGTEEGATVEYLVDGNWTTTAPVPTEGDNTITVRQTDAAGNTSGSSELTFTLDTTAPDAPTLTLDTDSGSAADDFLTNDGSFTVGGTEEGATVEYLVDGNWTTTAPVPTEGDNTITVRQTDAAGNTSGSSELTFTLDTTAPDAPTLTLDTDSGSAADDFLTNDGSFTVGGTEEGATVEYLVDGNWTTTAPVPTEGDNTITVRQTDAAGNTSGSSELTFTLDTTAPDAPTLTLDTDSGSAADDFLTNDGSFTVGGTEEGATVEYLVDGNWTTTAPVPTEGDNTITVRQTDAAGNTSGSSELTFTLDTTAPDAPTLTLDTDSGSAADDFLTNDGSFTVGGTEEGATVEYLVDGNWTTTAPVPTEGDNTITVRQTDAAGNTSGSSELTFTLDTTAPDAPTLTLDTDSGSAADDFLTNDGSFTVGGTEEGATVEYLVDGNWTTTAPVPTEGDNTITVRQTDAAGNTSGSSELTFTLDTTAPDAPTLTLDTDSGSAADDFLTNDGSFTVGGTEEGATVEYLVDGNWTTTAPVPTEGDNTITVRQTDAAGNTSGSSELTFTLDTTAPDAPTLTLDTDSGSAADDFLTNDGSFTVGGTEEGATVEYLVDGNWTTTAPVPTEGDNTITVRQTDAAGNTSGSSELTFTLDTTAPDAPTLTLDTDSGSAADDFLTNDGSFTVGGTEEGATVEYLVDGNWTTTAPVPTEGDNTITVRQTDAAGNTSGSSELTFTLDTTAPDAPTLTLDTDSGSAADDFLTNDGSFTVGGTEEGATVEYLVDGNWTTTAPVPTEGDNTITVRQTDAAGNTSGSSELTFTLDTTAPDAPTLTLDTDSGSAADDFLTNDGSFTVGGTEEGATVEYLVDGNWTTTAPVPTEGDNTITVRQTDAAGNTSGSSELTFTLDTTAPDAPTLTLDTDSGSAADDFLTNDGSFTVGGTEEGATVEYLVDGNWTTTAPVPTEGDNTITVRQTDAAGNTSGSSELTFTLDTTAPDAPT